MNQDKPKILLNVYEMDELIYQNALDNLIYLPRVGDFIRLDYPNTFQYRKELWCMEVQVEKILFSASTAEITITAVKS